MSCSKRQAKTASTACKGIVGKSLASLATALPHVAKEPSNTLNYIIKLGSHASSRPIFPSLLAEACDKLAFIKQVSPDVYYCTGDGIRSSFCSHSSIMGQCIPCKMLEEATTMYASRAEKKAESTMLTTRALLEQDASSLQVMASSATPHQTLTGQEMRQRAAIQSSQRRADSQRTSRAKYSLLDLKAQLKVFASKAEQAGDDTPELIKLFTMVDEAGKSNNNDDSVFRKRDPNSYLSCNSSWVHISECQPLHHAQNRCHLKSRWCPQGLLGTSRHCRRYYWTLDGRSSRGGGIATSLMGHG